MAPSLASAAAPDLKAAGKAAARKPAAKRKGPAAPDERLPSIHEPDSKIAPDDEAAEELGPPVSAETAASAPAGSVFTLEEFYADDEESLGDRVLPDAPLKKALRHRYQVKVAEGGQLIRDGKFFSFYRSGPKHEEGEYVNGKRHGQWKTFYVSGKPKREAFLSHGKLDGPWQSWYSSGADWQSGFYKDGQRDGQWMTLFHHGQLRRAAIYRDAQLDGEYVVHRGDGTVAEQGVFANGRRVGLWRFYDDKGRLVREVDFGGNPE